tara:strand:- start:29611 stop:30180 length:570 start_codon:yes stop_codon:yes gene_type:complete
MLIISFDIGIVNLGLTILQDETILIWEVIKLFDKVKKNINTNNLCEIIYIRMDDIIGKLKDITNDKIDYILLENQPSKGIMKTTQILLYGYFYNLKYYDNYVKEIIQVSASIKLEGIEMDKTCNKNQQYRNNKKKSIELCKELIKNDLKLEEIMNEYKLKQDDLCDSLLQIIGFLKKKNNIIEKVKSNI